MSSHALAAPASRPLAAPQQAAQQSAQQAQQQAEKPGPLAGELPAAELNPNEGVHTSDLVRAPQGLFPAPLRPGERGAGSKVRGRGAAAGGL